MQNTFKQPPFDYPEAATRPVAYHFETPDGPMEYTDDYAWLADHRTDPVAQTYLQEQRAFTDSYFAASNIESRLEVMFDELTNGGRSRAIGTRRGNKTYYSQAEPGDEFSKVVVVEDGQERVVVDPNAMEGNVSLSWFNVSPDGAQMVYSLMHDDREEPTVYLRNLHNQQETQFYSGDYFLMDWDADGQGFTYVTSHGRDYNAGKYYYQKLHHHVLGDDRSQDELLIDAADSALGSDVLLGFDRSADGQQMLIEAHKPDKTIDVYLFDISTRDLSQLFPEVESRCTGFLLDGHVFVRPDTGDDNQYIARTPIAEAAGKPLADWEPFIPSRPDHYIKSYDITKSSIVVEYACDVDSKVVLFDRQTGRESSGLELPPHSGLCVVRSRPDSETFDYTVGNAFTHQEVYRHSPEGTELLFGSHRNLNPSDYEVVKDAYRSGDGTRVPIYLAARRGIIGQQDAALIMDCYGGFMNGSFPEKQFTNLYRTWMALGQIAAWPCIRGGNEFGKDWHSQAVGANKYKTIDDINAAARFVHDSSISTRVGMSGGSNGGAMVLAAMMRQPEQYLSVEARVPLADMLQYIDLPGTAKHWVGEFGDPHNPEELASLQTWSPYHAVARGVDYPALLLTAGLNDTRVDASHAIKMAAKMQTLSPESLTLLHINPDSGHGHGMSASQWHAYYARRLAFHAIQLGVDLAA